MSNRIHDRFLQRSPQRLRNLLDSPRHIGRWLRPDTAFWAEKYYHLMTHLHAAEFRRRRDGAARLAKNLQFRIPRDTGYASLQAGDHPLVQAALARCDEIAGRADFLQQVGSSKKGAFLGAAEFSPHDAADRAIYDLACDPLLLSPICDYLGTVPVLHRAALSFSPNQVFVGHSQKYHFDSEDYRQVKCFVSVNEVTRDSGPLTVIPADKSELIYRALVKKGASAGLARWRDDTEIYSTGVVAEGTPLCGPRGTLLFVDTCKCLHYGSRPGRKPRLLLYFHYASAFSAELPAWGRRASNHRRSASGSNTEDLEARELVLGMFDLHLSRFRKKRGNKAATPGR